MFEKIKKFSLFVVTVLLCFSVSEVAALDSDDFANEDELPVRNEVQRLEDVDCFINIHVLNNTLSIDFGIANEKSLALHYCKSNEEDGLIIGNQRLSMHYHHKMIGLLSSTLRINSIKALTVFGDENIQHANITDQHILDVLGCLKGSKVSTLTLCLKLFSPELISSIKEKMSALPLEEVFFYIQEGGLYYLQSLILNSRSQNVENKAQNSEYSHDIVFWLS